jgi:hypothetical protein
MKMVCGGRASKRVFSSLGLSYDSALETMTIRHSCSYGTNLQPPNTTPLGTFQVKRQRIVLNDIIMQLEA